MARRPPQVAISYAQGYRGDDVLRLSNRLRHDGVDCEIDKYEPAPEIGWGHWMAQIMTERIVLVVASEMYSRRYHLQEIPGVGLGVTFESGLLVQRVLESQGRNKTIIPVLLDPSDARFIPDFLKDVTRYDVSTAEGYEDLLRRLTDQPAVHRPPLGTIPDLPPRPSERNAPLKRRKLILFQTASGVFGMPLLEFERGERLRLTLAPDDHADTAKLRALKSEPRHFSVAFGLTAAFARLANIRELMRDGEDRVELELTEVPFDTSFGTEMSYNGITSDQIAEMRVRRILLNEPVPVVGKGDWAGNLNQEMFERFVSAESSLGNRLAVKASPIPVIARSMGTAAADFIPVTQLFCTMLLILSGAVEHISRLDMALRADGMHVEFEGVRHRVYSNAQPPRISVSGVCAIDPKTGK